LPGAPILPADLGAPKGRLAEEYLRRLRRPPQVCDCGSGVDGRARPGDEPEPGGDVDGVDLSEAQLIRRQVAADVVAARAREQRSVPSGLARWASELLASTVDWRRELASLIRTSSAQVAGCVDYSFTRRSRRAATMPGVILPGLSRPVPDIAIVVDTSGSMKDKDLARCLAELDGIIAALGLRSRRAQVLAVDEVVQSQGRVSRANDVVLRGGGGTDMGAGIAGAVALRPRPQLVVVLTDGGTPWPAAPPARVRVVAGLLGDWSAAAVELLPSWITAVSIGDPA
jgi:predicted metal-dependent peptidase